MSYLAHLLVLVLYGLLLTSANGEYLVESGVPYRHAVNMARIKGRIAEETGIYHNIPQISPERMASLKAALNEPDFEEKKEKEAFTYIYLVGHSQANSSEIIFEYGQKMRSQHLESAKLIFFIRRPSSQQDSMVTIQVTDQMERNLAYAEVPTSSTLVKKQIMELSKVELARALSSLENPNLLTFMISARIFGDVFEDLLILPGRLGHMPHMGILLEVQVAAPKRDARRRRALSRRRQCRDGQDSCCLDVFEADWRALNITNVIAPVKFGSAVCRGSCEEFEYTDYMYTARRQRIQNHLKRACCHPVEFRDAHLMWVDQSGNVHSRNIPSYAPSRCSCD